jgi:hypothetical protein
VGTARVVEDLEVGPPHEELLQVDEHVLLLHSVVERMATFGPLGAHASVDRPLDISPLDRVASNQQRQQRELKATDVGHTRDDEWVCVR